MAKKKEVVITCNATNVKAVIEGLERGMAALAKEEEKLLNTIKQRGYAENDEKKRLKELEKAMDAMRTNVQKNREEQKKLAEVMKDLAGAKLKDLKKALQEGKAALNNMSARDPNREKLVHDLQRIQKQIETNTGALKSHGSAWQSAVKNITAYVGVCGAFNFVKNKLTEVIRGGEELSDQMAQVRMVSGLAMEDIEDLTRTLAKMDTRTTLSELERIAYAGAKLGFGEYGTKGLEEFVRAANQVNVALREDLGEEALTALSKITENMGLIKKMGVEDAMLATSSAMFKLAATSTAAAGPIVEVTKRLVPVAQASGMATHEILALASASDSLQLMPEVVGTALSKLLMAMQNNHNLIEQTLGIDEGTIARMIKAGDVMDAMLMIFDKMSGKNMTELSGIWKLLGSDGQRLITVVQAMANHTDTLRKHLETSTQAFKEATAVTEEYNIQQETAAALMQRASNLWRNAMVNADTSLSVKEMAKSWYDFSKSVLDSEFSLGAIKVTIDALLGSIRLLINLLPMIAFGLMAKGAAMLTMKLLSAKMSVDSFTLSWKKMDAATKSNWIGLAIGLFAQLAFSIAQWAKSNEEAEATQKKLNDAINSAADKAEQEINAMSRLKAQVEDTSLSQEERMKMFSKFKTDYDIYLNYLGIELKSVDELAKHYDALTKVMRQRFAYQEREDYKRDVMGGEDGLRMRRRTAGSDLTRIANDINQKVDLSVIDSYVASGVKPGEISQKILGKRPNVQVSIPTDKLRDAIVHYAQARLDETLKEKQIDAAFAQEIGDFDYDKWLRTQVKGDFKLKPDKEALKAAKKAAQDHKKALKLEMDEAQKASTGIISKLEEYYRLQEAAINDARADGQLTEEQAKEMVRALSIAKNESLATARRAVTTGDTKDWDELKTKVLPAVMSDTSEVSRNLLSTIQQVAVDKLHADLEKFNGSSDVLGLDSRAFFDQMNAKAAGNTREAARLRAKIQNEVEKALLQYQFVEKANLQMRKDLEAIGITTETYEQWAKRMQQGITEKPATVTSSGRSITDQEAYREMGNKFVDMGVINFRYNIENQQEAEQWLNDFATTSAGELEDWAQAFPELVEWIDLIKRKEKGETLGEVELQALQNAMPQIKNLYNEMMRHADRVNKAMKQAYEHEKSQQDIRFQVAGYRKQESEADSAWESIGKQKESGINASFWEQQGLGSVADDPEVQRIQNRIYWRNQELLDAQAQFEQRKILNEQEIQALKDRNASEAEIEALRLQQKQDNAGIEELINEKQTQLFNETSNLSAKVAQELQKRVQAVNTLVKPVETAAKNIGQKLGDMIFDMESQSMTWEEIWKNMALAVAESMLSMAGQYAQNAIVKASMNRAEETEEGAHATVMTMFGISEGAAKTIGTLGWIGIALIPVITALLMGLLTSALSTSRNDNGNTAATPKTKLVSGMLTYDRGNVDKFAGRRKLYDDGETQVYGRRRYLGEDGKVYTATAEPAPKDGLVTHPIATTVQGQPALVAENGPEIVIGRETTKAIMMNEPELIKYLANYQQQGARRLFDSGNAATVLSGSAAENTQPSDAAAERQALINRLDRSDALMEQVLYFLQNPIPPEIAMYDTGGKKGLRSKMKEADRFMARYDS